MAAAAAVITRRQRDIVETFQGARATSPDTARHPGELGVEEDHIFRGLIRRAVLRPGDDGRYYVDEPSWRALGMARRRVAFIALFIALLISAFVLVARH